MCEAMMLKQRGPSYAIGSTRGGFNARFYGRWVMRDMGEDRRGKRWLVFKLEEAALNGPMLEGRASTWRLRR
jgi:hypothetical protein